jgi:hypothetical protein
MEVGRGGRVRYGEGGRVRRIVPDMGGGVY